MALTETDIKIVIAAELKKAGFDKAKKATDSLDKTFKKLGKTIGISLSATAIANFAKESIKAFQDDEKAARRLTQTLSNMGLAFEDPRMKAFIGNLESTSGVLDDQLRPAMQSLLTTTGSVTRSQELLTLALDISAGSGEDVVTVAQDLAKAYVGTTKGLQKYNLGLSKTELSSKSFVEIQDLLNKQFSGQNAARLDTFSGKVALLNVAFANSKEIIGKGLVDAFSELGGNNGIGGTTKAIEDFSNKIADAIVGVGLLISSINSIPGLGTAGRFIFSTQSIPVVGAWIDILANLGQASKNASKPFSTPMTISGQSDLYSKQDAARKKAEEAAAKRAKELAALQKKAELDRIKREKQAQQLKRAGSVFDLENIQIVAALQGKVTEAQRLRLVALLAINTDNADAADKLTKAILALQAPAINALGVTISTSDNAKTIIDRLVDAQTKLVLLNGGIANIPAAKNPFEGWTSVMAKIIGDLDTIAGKINNLPVAMASVGGTGGNTGVGGSAATVIGGSQTPTGSVSPIGMAALAAATNAPVNPAISNLGKRTGDFKGTTDAVPNVTVIVQGSVISEQDLASTITDIQYQYQRAGLDTRVSSIAI
jgi:hypothetical protein